MRKAISTPLLVFVAAIGLALVGPAARCAGWDGAGVCIAGASPHATPGSATATATAAAKTEMLVGNSSIERSADSERPGRSEAFPFRARRSGTATRVSLYVSRSNRAKQIAVAVYGGARQPASLLTSGSTRHIRPGHWVRIGVNDQRLSKGTRYWLAVLGTGGRLAYRDGARGSCKGTSLESAERHLKGFPRHWRAGARVRNCRISEFVSGRLGGSLGSTPAPSPPTPTPPAPTPTPTPPTSPSPPPLQTKNCFPTPSACGYPDTTNTGVPAGVTLTPSSSITVHTAGTVISGKDVTGEIEVSANNVTIKDTRVTNTGNESSAIHVDGGVTGTTIEDSTLRGQAPANGIQYSVSNSGDGSVGLRLQMYNCSECWAGNGTLQDSYAISNAVINGAHYEAVYIPGGTTQPTDLEHNTLLNPNEQTAGIFGDDHAYGPIHNLTIDKNLVADGGDNGGIATGCKGDGNTNVNITNNRLSFAYDKSMATGGYGSGGAWTNNYRDDNLAQLKVAC